MENSKDETHSIEDNGNAIFGTSSDAIIEGLHQGQFIETGEIAANFDDDKKIVNEQEQNEIINPLEKDAVTASVETNSPEDVLPATEKENSEISEAETPLKKPGSEPEKTD